MLILAWAAFVLATATAQADSPAPVSEETETCIDCHATVTPGIVGDWLASRHAQITVAEALEKSDLQRTISADEVPSGLMSVSVGCAECHMLNPEKHADTFDHVDSEIHVVVTPTDCATCHPVETEQYSHNLMSHAYGNLAGNALYGVLVGATVGVQDYDGKTLMAHDPDNLTHAEACYYCHGTQVTVTGTRTEETDFGDLDFPVLSGWPNQGVGRINPDGSRGSCAACHTRHRFSIETARKPHTCSECHKGPDVPAYKVYSVSKHGNIYSSHHDEWDFGAVPWTVGTDFQAPTCAVCHVSLLTTEDEEVIAERTHRMNDRLEWRIFGLPYAHLHPISPNTTGIVNAGGLPLPTELTGEPASKFLISPEEGAERRERLQQVCLACHSSGWVKPQFERLDHTIKTTNEMTLTATEILSKAWDRGLAQGPAQGGTPFDEPIEKRWVEQWLFYANSTRFASAMAGADYGVFANGRWELSKNVREMEEWVRDRTKD
jgi:hypothetical protein